MPCLITVVTIIITVVVFGIAFAVTFYCYRKTSREVPYGWHHPRHPRKRKE